jgi:hypothetical protein|tara:strand:+ start:159 stop:1139 length:981 start_codon:yes stop_codon:yes gene_type:complete
MNNQNTRSPLSETATLVRLTTKFWSGIKTDKGLRVALADDVKADDDRCLHVAKHLVGVNANKQFRRIINKVRNGQFYPLTLAWDDSSTDDEGKVLSGWRLCPNTRLDDLLAIMSKARDDFFKEVDGFCENYPRYIEKARSDLGDAFKISDYPDVDVIKSKFKFEFEIQALPSYGTDIRTTASEQVAKRIEKDAIKRERRNIENTMRDFVGGIIEQGEHLAEKLASYDPKQKQKGGFFKNSSIEKFKANVQMIPSVNADILGNDKDVAKAHQGLVQILAQINNVDSLRDETEIGESKRQTVSDNLTEVIDPLKNSLLDSLYGGKKND